MVPRKILVIDDDSIQAKALAKTIEEVIPHSSVIAASTEDEIDSCIEDKFYNLVVLDIRMDGYRFDGIYLAERIIEINPFAKILFVSKFIPEYLDKLNQLLHNGNILGLSDKKIDYEQWKPELERIITSFYNEIDNDPQKISSALIDLYAEVKDEEDTYRKGIRFENFVALLFQSIGFSEILKRTRDISQNEIDLIIRNDIDDSFLSKFGKYILIECKNKPNTKTDKNDLIIFQKKLECTNGLAELGFIITTSTFTSTARTEVIRSSKDAYKIIFIDNPLMMRLIKAENPREQLKQIIDSQVKDN